MNTQIKSLTIEELFDAVASKGLPRFRAQQILEWLYGKSVSSYEEMTNLPKNMRSWLNDEYPLFVPRQIARELSVDGSRKYLVELFDGTFVETVAMPHDDGRLSVCISSQAGCAMKCSFCATGKNGLVRNLLPGELVDQVLTVQHDFDKRVTNVVVMGQGEPFANYDSTIAALRIINHPKCLNIGARHITVSTCGIISGIERFSEEPEQFTLAISLHSAQQNVRDNLMPAVSNQPLPRLRETLENYARITGRRFSFEYALMKGVNDSQSALESLIDYCQDLLCHVNLIPLNEIDDSPYQPVSSKVMAEWQRSLETNGVPCSIRNSRGSDISGACGQLASKHERLVE